MRTFVLPDLGEGLREAEIVAWHVSVGDHVVADQPLLAVETDKAVVEIPVPWSGRIAHIHGDPGDVVATGAPLVDFEEGEHADTGAIVGELPAPEAREEARVPGLRPAVRHREAVKATPAVRALAHRLGVDLAAVEPTGPGDLVIAADVERAAATLTEAVRLEPLRGARRAMADAMARSHAEVVPATVSDEADVEEWPTDTDPMVRLVRAVAAGCRVEPALNAWLDTRARERRLHERVDLGVAVDTPDGLFVPVLRRADALDAETLRTRLDALITAVRDRTIALEDLRGATITLSNFGPLGGRQAALVIIPPQVAILGAGRIAPAAVAVAGKPAVRRTMPLSLTFDHRAVTGGEAARFLAAVIADLEKES
jgi:pyruvate dehydrogenase E2 component (dihydrolipoamide acetyltransferase)